MNRVQSYFDTVAETYAARYEDAGPAGHALAIRWQRVWEAIGEPTGRILDAGCGPGVFLAALDGRDVVGLDLSLNMAAAAQYAAPRARLTVGSLDRLPFADGSFDLVVAMGAVEYVPDHWQAFAELVRVLRPGGRLIASFPNRASVFRLWRAGVFFPLVDLLRPLVYAARGRPAPPTVTSLHHSYRERDVRSVLAAWECRVETVVYLNYQVLLSPLDELAPAASAAVSRCLEPLTGLLPHPLATAFLVVARKTAADRPLSPAVSGQSCPASGA